MPRISRAIAIGYPHHVTQRGNYRQTVFAETADYTQYLDFLAQYAPQCDLERISSMALKSAVVAN
jgi:putative transposase